MPQFSLLLRAGKGRVMATDTREGHPYGAAASLTWWLWYSVDAPTACLELVLGTFLALKFSVPSLLLGKKKKVP